MKIGKPTPQVDSASALEAKLRTRGLEAKEEVRKVKKEMRSLLDSVKGGKAQISPKAKEMSLAKKVADDETVKDFTDVFQGKLLDIEET